MRNLIQVAIFEFKENIRNKWIFAYGIFFFLISSLLIYFGGNESAKIIASLLSIILLLVPLFALLFGSMNFLDSMSFMEVIFTRPISRLQYFNGKWFGLSFALNIGYLLGAGLPILLFTNPESKLIHLSVQLLLYGMLLNWVFISIAILVAITFVKREVVLSMSLAIWFYLYLLYDLIMLGVSINFGEYPLEVPILILTCINPLDLVRIITILQMDNAVLLGFTSAFFQKYLGNTNGIILCITFLNIWAILPFYIGYRVFKKKDL
ncbi:MAG TPA: ABC transporter permease subunit [Leptospiraceae bacterium]|nr:ABC transporter permease subunit [Leptospiraceae bacterium]HMW06375.1 ABC transporter permease subunit [Leptospiraceae bacterium]HMX31713.1 ABC transporter permease subunit [Leptospiraceae bacterium]HMY31999.1 ABC transporter permease subunit [Leptospiraceae bacterium]HMZ65788.1 ABC transporter permease subunit [Leptospiraceae bacterium]